MRASTILTLGAMSVSAVSAANLEDVLFLTALVGDFDDHKGQYIAFLKTASGVPSQLTSLAVKVITYTDEAYTTLLDNSQLDISQLKSFATKLPWYSRIAAEVSDSSAQSSSSDSSSDSSSAASSSGSGASMLAPAGAFVGAVAVLLL